MLTTNFLKTRTSTRDFLDEKVSEEDLKKVNALIEKETEKLGDDKVDFIVTEDGEKVYEALLGSAGYGGVMIKAPMYIALNTMENHARQHILGAYGMEELITKLIEMGLGCCWISLSDVEISLKSSLFDYDEGEVDHLLAVGYPLDKEVKEHRYDDRLGVTELVYIGDFNHKASIQDLEQYGLDNLFHYARFAPSAYNAQPWRFLVDGGEIKLYIKEYKNEINLLDAGIIMYYIDELTKNYSGLSEWELNEELIDPKQDGKEFVYIAKKTI